MSKKLFWKRVCIDLFHFVSEESIILDLWLKRRLKTEYSIMNNSKYLLNNLLRRKLFKTKNLLIKEVRIENDSNEEQIYSKMFGKLCSISQLHKNDSETAYTVDIHPGICELGIKLPNDLLFLLFVCIRTWDSQLRFILEVVMIMVHFLRITS